MKKIIFKTIAILLIVAGVMACKKEKDEVFPQEIPFTEYSLEETSCQWSNLSYDREAIVVNSHAALENYVTCTEGTFPEIDFAEHTLLLASGGAGSINEFTYTFFKNSENKYTLKVFIRLSPFLPVALQWRICIVTPKISDNAIVDLDVQESFN